MRGSAELSGVGAVALWRAAAPVVLASAVLESGVNETTGQRPCGREQ